MDQSSKKISPKNESYDQDLDLRIILNFLNRNKIFLSKFSLIFFVVGSLISFLPKKTWEGQFQIVMNLEGNRINTSLRGNIPKILQNTLTSNNLQTEVGILESPSVLMPVYEFSKSRKNNISRNNFSFIDWKKNLSIELSKGTSILNIAYRDKNKENILPILKNMSISYQKYSGISKKRLLENSNNYLKSQIKIYKDKSASSLKAAQEFAIDQDLMYFDQTIPKESSIPKSDILDSFDLLEEPKISIESSIPSLKLPESNVQYEPKNALLISNLDIENVRVQAANEIRIIDLQLKKIAEIDNKTDFQYTGITIPALVETGLPQNLQLIETELVELRSKYTDDDMSIKRLLEKRKLTIDLLKERSINFLKALRLEAESKMESATRPKGVLLRYKELIRNADRDENTLIKLENQLTINELEKSKQKDPWQLITKPTLLRDPVPPRKIDLALISLLVGFLLGIIYLSYKEKKSERIFELKDILKIKAFQFIEKINLDDVNLFQNKVLFIKEFINNQSKDKVNLILLGEIKENDIKTFKEILLKQINKKLIITSNFEDIKENSKFSTNLIISSFGDVSFSQLKILKNYEELLEIDFPNLILFE